MIVLCPKKVYRKKQKTTLVLTHMGLHAFSINSVVIKQKGLGIRNKKTQAQLRFESISDNLYRIFGTHKFFRIFSPSFRNVPFTGLEWSFRFKDEGYDCDGYRNAVARRGVSLNPNQEDESDEDEDELKETINKALAEAHKATDAL